MKKYLNYTTILISTFLITMLILDGGMFIYNYQSEYDTPWFSSDVLREPTTNLILLFFGEKTLDEWKPNAIRSENWHVVQYKFGKKTFWSVLEREPIGAPK